MFDPRHLLAVSKRARPSATAIFLVVAGCTVIFTTIVVAANSLHAAFASENEAAMTRMMTGMAIKPTGDIDQDFAAMMIPHHQGAIDMAESELRYGSNEQLRRIAQEIIVDQQQEIAAMHLALDQPLPRSMASPTQFLPASAMDMRTPAALPSMPLTHTH